MKWHVMCTIPQQRTNERRPRMQILENRIMTIVSRGPCSLDELVAACPHATWGQIFGEVDRLSRARRVTLQRQGRGVYIITTSLMKEDRHEHVNTLGTV